MAFDLAQTVLMTVLALGQPAAVNSDEGKCGGKAADAPIRVRIEKDRVSVLHEGQPASCGTEAMSKDAFAVSCRELKSEVTSDGGRTLVKLVCTDAEFSTGNGMRGRAAQLLYDSSRGTLELRGTADQHVRFWFDPSPSNKLQFTARDAEIDLQRSQLRLLEHLSDPVLPALECCCALGCLCAEGGCCTRRAPAPPGTVEPPQCPPAEPFERVFQFGGIRFIR